MKTTFYICLKIGLEKILPGTLLGMNDVPTFGIRPENITM